MIESAVPEAPDCLAAFYGARSRRNTIKSMVSPGERPQEIYTPECVRDAILNVWPHIALDPCGGPDSLIPAKHSYYVPPAVIGLLDNKGVPKCNSDGTPKIRIEFIASAGHEDGLNLPWCDYTYANPPFRYAKQWLAKALHEAGLGHEIMMLAQTRGHRSWFRKACKSATCVCDLNPLKFVGFKQTFPAPLCMLYWGDNTNQFELAFEHLGECR